MTSIEPKKAAIALRSLHDRLLLEKGADIFKTYSAIRLYCEEAFQWCDDNPEANSTYLQEKLTLYLSCCDCAVFPVEGDHKSPSQWLSSASDNLMKVENFARNQIEAEAAG